jgi:hypothetical protein
VKLKGFEIVELLKGEKAGFYSVKFYGEDKSEAEKFFEKLESEDEEKLENLYSKIEYQAEVRGCLDSLLFYERDNTIYKFKEGDWRLYCIRFGKVAVILGGGDIKDVQKTQDSQFLENHVNRLQEINKVVNERIKENDLTITENGLKGNLNFEAE